jgi:hypothetical protein
MTNYNSAFTGAQIDEAIGLANTAVQPEELNTYATRSDLVIAVAGGLVAESGLVYQAAGLSYRGQTGATVIADLPGLVPNGWGFFEQWGAVGDGIANDSAALQTALDSGWAYLKGTPSAIYRCNSSILVPSNRWIDFNGARIRRGFATSWALRSSLSFLTWDNEEIHLKDIWIDDDGTLATRGGGLCMVGDRITIDGYRNTMSAPPDGITGAWATFVSGKDITIRRLFVDTTVCGLYSDGFHTGYLENFTMTDFHIRSGDDSIALHSPPAAFSFSGKDLPSRNIEIQGGFVSSAHSNGLRIGAWGAASNGGLATKANVCWSNVNIDLTIGQCGTSCIEMVDDRATSEITANTKSTDISIRARVELQDNLVRIVNIKGNPDIENVANLSQHNYGRVYIDIDAAASDTTSENLLRAGGCDYLEIGGTLRYFDETSPTLTNMNFLQSNDIVLNGLTTQGRTNGTFCNFKWVENIELVDLQHLADGTNEFQTFVVTVTPEVGTSFRMHGGRIAETQRTIVINGTGRLKDFIVSGTQLEGTSAFPLSATFNNVTWDAGGIFSFYPAKGLTGTVANLPSTAVPVVQGHLAFATNGRKAAEGAGAGTGQPVYRNGTSWRCVRDDSVVLA